jgi:hypothetical protein
VDHYVATPCTYKDTGIANSQTFAQSTSVPAFTWTSETQMIQQFSTQGYTDSQITALFDSHRANYLLEVVSPNWWKSYKASPTIERGYSQRLCSLRRLTTGFEFVPTHQPSQFDLAAA